MHELTLKRGPGRPPKARPAEAATAPETFPVRLLFGYFPLNGGAKVPAGTVAHLPVAEAVGLIKDGRAERADPLPGE